MYTEIKRILFIALLSIALFGTTLTAGNRKHKVQEPCELTNKALEEHKMTVEVNYINPTGVPSFPSFEGYTLSVEDGKVKAYLPYFGRGYAPIVYGADETGIVFKDCEIELEEDYSKASKGKYIWRFSAKSGNENVDVIITFMNDGSAQILCNCDRRSPITFMGDMIEENPEKE